MRLERFGSLALSMIEAEDDLRTGSARLASLGTIAGEYDSHGAGDAPVDGVVLAREFELHGATTDDLDDARDALRAVIGTRARLYARMGDDAVRWVNARLLDVQERRTRRNFNFQRVVCRFHVPSPIWQGHDHTFWTLDSGELLDDALYLDDAGYTVTLSGSSTDVVVTNGGNRVVTNPVITITAGGANITAVTITKTGETKIAWTGTLVSTKSLVIDCGKFTILNDGANAYSGKAAFDSNHTIAEWLRIDPGSNTVTVAFTGGSTDSTATIEFRDGWA